MQCIWPDGNSSSSGLKNPCPHFQQMYLHAKIASLATVKSCVTVDTVCCKSLAPCSCHKFSPHLIAFAHVVDTSQTTFESHRVNISFSPPDIPHVNGCFSLQTLFIPALLHFRFSVVYTCTVMLLSFACEKPLRFCHFRLTYENQSQNV